MLQPGKLAILNMGVQIYLPAPFYALISPCDNQPHLAVYQLNSVSSTGCGDTIRVTVKNTSEKELILKANTPVLQLIICRKSDSQKANAGSVEAELNDLHLVQQPSSFLHYFLDKYAPTNVRCLELNTSIALPDSLVDKFDIVHQLNGLNHKLMGSVAASTLQPITERPTAETPWLNSSQKNWSLATLN
jgi:hypothetical protein